MRFSGAKTASNGVYTQAFAIGGDHSLGLLFTCAAALILLLSQRQDTLLLCELKKRCRKLLSNLDQWDFSERYCRAEGKKAFTPFRETEISNSDFDSTGCSTARLILLR